MNTCLQNLIHCVPFVARLDKLSAQLKGLSYDFYNLCRSQAESSRPSAPHEVKAKFGRKHPEYGGYSQHDTQEFCRYFLEDVSKELNTVKKLPPYKEINDKGKTKMQIREEYDNLFRSREDSIVVDTFYGQFVNIFKCKCNFESFSFQQFLDIPLLMDSRNNSIENLFDKYFENDEFEWGSKCEGCSKKAVHTKYTKLALMPEVLILSLQRFNERSRRKNNNDISFSKSIDLSKYADTDCVKSVTEYELVGIGNHSGTMDFGHYYAYVKVKDDWYEFNDSSAFRCSINYTSRTAYVLFYQRVDTLTN